MSSFLLLGVGMGSDVVGGTTTWNPSDKNADITLSGGNLTATDTTSADVYENVRAIASHSSGQYYYEATYSSSTTGEAIGIGNSSAVLNFWIGSSTTGNNAVGWTGSTVDLNGVSLGAADALATNTTLSIAADLTNKLIWVRLGAGNWNANVSANPATGTGGYSFASITGPYFPMATISGTGGAITANFGATSYLQSVPSGFGNW